MNPLITIETVPISIEYREKKPEKVASQARLQIAHHDDAMSIRSNPIRIKMDTFELSKPMDSYSFSYTATAQYSSDGNLKLNFQTDASDNSYQFTQVGRGIDNIIDYIDFDMSNLPGGLPTVDNIDTSFLPPDIEIRVVERPKVIIKYVGGPLYIPKSADPNYVPPEGLDKIS